jgi:cell division protein FtsB
MRAEMEAMEKDVAALRRQTEQLTATVERLRSDPSFLEKLAREDLGLVREGDTVLKFPSPGR